jgi:hypothetical protein
MSARDVRDVIVDAWAYELSRNGCRHSHTVALKLAVIAEAHGIKFIRPAHIHDPNADWSQPPTETTPAAAAPDVYHAAKAALPRPDRTET